MSSSGEAIRLEVGRILNGLRDEQMLRELVNTGTSAAQITDSANLASTRFTPQQFHRWAVRVTSGGRDGDGSYAGVLTVASGILAVSPNFSGALANTDTLELWNPKGPHPDDLDRARDRALSQRCTRWRLAPLTYAVDGDFVASGVTNWTGSGATATKTTRSGLERVSEQVLKVANSGLNGYAGQTINCREGEAWHFYALAQADVGTAQITIQDLTNAAAVALTGLRNTWAGESFQIIEGEFTVPTGCEQISVRLGGQETNAETYWASLTIVPQDAREFVLPSRVVNRTFVGGLQEVSGTNWPEESITRLDWKPDLIDISGGVRIVLPQAAGTRNLFVEEWCYFDALQSVYNTAAGRAAGDAATTNCPLPYAAWATLRELYGPDFEAEFQKVHRQYGAGPRAVRVRRDHPEKAYA